MELYSIKELQQKLENSVIKVETEIIEEFEKSFKFIYANDIVPDSLNNFNLNIEKKRISSFSDFKGVFSGNGFYIILTNRPIENNQCKLKMGELTAVYRGQASTVKKRLSSHLTNKKYDLQYSDRKTKYEEKNNGKKFYEKYFSACMKFQSGLNGIDVDDAVNENYHWHVIVHNMKDSKERVRELAEKAFDNVFGKPIASREN